MAKRLSIAFLGMLAVVGLWWWISELDGESAHPPSSSGSGAVSGGAQSGDHGEGAAEAGEAAIPTQRFRERDDAAGSAIRIHTLRGSRRPYPGALVTARIYVGHAPIRQTPDGDPVVEQQLRSDENGWIAWRPALPQGAYVLWFSGPSENHWSFPEIVRVVPPGAPPDPIEVSMYPYDVWIEGTVSDVAGQPIADAQVRTRFASVRTDERGGYRFASPSEARRVQVRATARGFAQKMLVARDPKAGTTFRLDFSLDAGTELSGLVVDENGDPFADAEVHTSGIFVETQTGQDGRYVITGLPTRMDRLTIYAGKKGLLETRTSLELPFVGDVPNLVLKRGVAVRGSVLGPDGSPVRGAELYIGFSPAAANRLDAVSDDHGRFSFPCVAPGGQTLVTHASRLAPSTQKIQVPDDQAAVELDVHLDAGHYVGGRCSDASGKPLGDIRISARHHGEYIDALKGRTAPDGTFRMDGLPADELSLEFYATGILRHVHKVEVVDRDDVVVVLRRPGGVAGRVVDAATDSPLKSFRVRFVQPETKAGEEVAYIYGYTWAGAGTEFSVPDGRWRASNRNLEVGHVLGLEIRASGYYPAIVPRVVVSEGADPDALVIRMDRGGTIEGRVVDAGSGNPVPQATVSLVSSYLPYPREWPDRRSTGYYEGARPTAKTDTRGVFHLRDVPKANFSLVVHPKEGGQPHVEGPMNAAASGRPLLIEIPLRGRVTGTVADARGDTFAGSVVKLWRQPRGRDPMLGSFSETLRTQCGKDGNFTIEGVPPSEYSLGRMIRFGGRERVAFAKYVTVDPGATLNVRLAPTGNARVTGRLEGLGDNPQEVLLEVVRTDRRRGREERRWRRRAQLCRGPTFEIHALEPGAWRINAYCGKPADGLRGGAMVTIEDGQVQDVTLSLTRRR